MTKKQSDETPVEKRRRLSELIQQFRANLHAGEIVELVDANPWLNDQIPYDVGKIVRRSARSSVSEESLAF